MKKRLYSIVVFFMLSLVSFGQISSIVEEFDLPATVSETSGLIYFNNKIITHNDSGGANELYEIDLGNETISRTVTISNATNIDWEDIAQDETSIYIADIGNNYGTRTNLVIYKINKTDYLASTSVMAETIQISYSDQTDFTSNLNNNEWDAEAIVSYNGDLLLFNKNWVDGITKAYVVSKTPGTYSVLPMTTTLNSGIRITGGAYNTISGKLYLIGYNNTLQSFVWTSEGFATNDIFSGTNTSTPIFSSIGLEQTEGITYLDEDEYYVSSESISALSINAKLISFTTNDVSLSIQEEINNNDVVVYPNPAKDFLHIESETIVSIELYNTNSVKLFSNQNSTVDMRNLEQGIYFLKINFEKDVSILKKIIKF